LRQALDAGAEMILLDNMESRPDARSRGDCRRSGVLEASGNVSLDSVRAIAETGVDRISVGSLTKDVRAVDLSMRFQAQQVAAVALHQVRSFEHRVSGFGSRISRDRNSAGNRYIIRPERMQSRLAVAACAKGRRGGMLFALFYVLAIVILIMHFTGFLARHNLEWLVLVLAVAVFPAVIYL
jgi:hypothetical protein